MIDKALNKLNEAKNKGLSLFMDVLKESKFYEEGILTPEEYLAAGNYLVTKCPTWKWSSNKSNIQPVNYLPKDKQFLITTVSCIDRVKSLEGTKINEKIVEFDWVEAEVEEEKKVIKYIQDIDICDIGNKKTIGGNQKNVVDVDIDNLTDDFMVQTISNQQNDPIIIEVVDDDNNVKLARTYDVTITYDFYYRVPRMWLIGYSEQGFPLSDKEIKEDIMLEYIDKTVTIETHPNLGVKSISIHPCRHSLLLKKMITNFEYAGKKLEVEKSIILFLKFLSSIVPTIKYDFTLDINF